MSQHRLIVTHQKDNGGVVGFIRYHFSQYLVISSKLLGNVIQLDYRYVICTEVKRDPSYMGIVVRR